MELLPLILFAPLLLWAAVSDMRAMRIPNVVVVCGLILFAVSGLFLPLEATFLRLLAGAVILVTGFMAFAARLVGAGDVKLLAVLMLFVPHQSWPLFGLVFSVAMIVGILFVLTLRAAPFASRSRAVGLRAKGMFPMGVSIALAGWLHPIALSALEIASG